jgi:hypothetical protein
MNDEEVLILRLLESSPDAVYSRREIARKAVRRKVFDENPNWAAASITHLLDRGEIEEDASGGIHCKPHRSH